MAFGSPEAQMVSIAREHYDAVYRFCARRVGMDQAADVAQETFITAQRALPKFRGDSNLSTWLFGIAHNECRRLYRRTKCEPRILDMNTEVSSDRDSETRIVDRHALHLAISKLSQEHREVVILHELEGFSYDEAAEILSIPVGTVKSRLHHAFAHLRRSLFAPIEARP